MNFDLSESQVLMQDALDGLVDDFRSLPTGVFGEFVPAPELESRLSDAGFFSIAVTEDYGPLDAALMIYEAARLPFLIEVAASALVAPMLGEIDLPRPIAITDDRHTAIRNLPGAQTLLLLEGNQAHVASLKDVEVESLSSVLGYPFGKLASPESLSTRSLGPESGAELLKWWRIALATEAAGLLKAAFDCTTEYVCERKQFGRAIGSFQAVQHRLAHAVQRVSGCQWLAFKAAATGSATDAAIAALYAQDQMRTVITDVHQFSGALGLTMEYPLHLWTYRLKALQGELGGMRHQAEAALEVFEAEEA